MSGDPKKKKRIAIIVVSTFLLVAMVVAVAIGVTFTREDEYSDPKDNSKSHVSSTMKAVKTLCQPTDYKQECINNLKAEAGNTTDPRELLKLAFNITIHKIVAGAKTSQLLLEVEKEPRAKIALDSCKTLMDSSIQEFSRSMEKVSQFAIDNIDVILANVKVWLSGAITYQETCLDGFENTTSPAGQKMTDTLKIAMHLSSNALAIISEMAQTFSDLHFTKESNGRRLLQDDDEYDDVLGQGRHLLEHDDEDDDHTLGDGEFPAEPGGLRRLLAISGKRRPNLIVAKDGSGKFTSINRALKHVPKNNRKAFIIYIKEGVYKEYVRIEKNMTHVVMIGDGGEKTRITGNKNFIDGFTTYTTCTVAVEGDFFTAINMGFENTAGASKHQAVALRVRGDMAIFYKCSMDGYQDTLYTHAMRQFYRDCTISGTIDFVFGDAASVFQNCTFKVRKPMDNQNCIVTAQGRKERHQSTGIVIQGGSIVADPEYYPFRFDQKAYLARPWKIYSRTIFMDTYIDDLIQPVGFLPWTGNLGLDTCYYAEYNNRGPGSDKSKRVKWPGIKNITAQQAANYIPTKFFMGDKWIRNTGLPYTPGMLKDGHHANII